MANDERTPATITRFEEEGVLGLRCRQRAKTVVGMVVMLLVVLMSLTILARTTWKSNLTLGWLILASNLPILLILLYVVLLAVWNKTELRVTENELIVRVGPLRSFVGPNTKKFERSAMRDVRIQRVRMPTALFGSHQEQWRVRLALNDHTEHCLLRGLSSDEAKFVKRQLIVWCGLESQN